MPAGFTAREAAPHLQPPHEGSETFIQRVRLSGLLVAGAGGEGCGFWLAGLRRR